MKISELIQELEEFVAENGDMQTFYLSEEGLTDVTSLEVYFNDALEIPAICVIS
jgi:hypothetical protein